MKLIDNYLDRITMYRLVLYYLIFLLGAASVVGFLGFLPYGPTSIFLSVAFILCVSYITNKIFSTAFDAPTNVESVYISALILALIISPMRSLADLPLLFWASVLTVASKYILAINKKHIFNPVAVAVVLTALGFNGSASWWIGTSVMLPFSLLGILIVRKIRRADLVFYFFLTSLLTMFAFTVAAGGHLLVTLREVVTASPIFFFAFVMLTEPLTTPPTKKLQVLYGALVGILFAPEFHIGSFYATPEQALIIGNVFSYIVSPKYKLLMTLKEKIKSGVDTMDFVFDPKQKVNFTPGQYMEWTLQHNKTDRRGNRRYFTIASSPTEKNIMLGVKFYGNGSSYKKAMLKMDEETPIVGTQLSGDFTLPSNRKQKLAFIAGGIGITPFRSMVKYLIDMNQSRQIVILYSNKTADEVSYHDVFKEAAKLGIKTVYTLTEKDKVPANWQGNVGRIDAEMIKKEIPDYLERVFYLSGPHVMVQAYKKTLRDMGVSTKNIKIDFFPGFA